MALAYRATPAVTQSSGAVTSFPVTKQSGTAAGDWIFLYATCVNSGTLACTGFTVTAPDSDQIGCLLYRLADGTEGSTFTITGIPSSTAATVGIATVSGATPSITVGTCATAGAANTSFTNTSITMPSSGWTLWFGGEQNGFTGPGYAITAPSGFTSRATNGAQSANAALMIADNQSAAAGATGGKTGTCGTAAFWTGDMVGLTPALVTTALAGTASFPAPVVSESAITYRATPAVTQSSGAVTSFPVSKQAGTVAGDWILLYMSGVNSSTTIACTGFTVTAPDSDQIGCLLYRLADGTEGSTFTITGIPASTAVTAGIVTLAGANSAVTVGACSTAGAANTSFTASGITMPAAGRVIWFGLEQLGFTGNSFAVTPPSGFTSRATNGTQTNNACLMIADNQSAASGATGGKTGTCGTAAYWSGIMVGLTPATVVVPSAVSGSVSLPGPVVTVSPVVTAAALSGTIAFPAPTAVAGSITVTPPALAVSAAFPAPAAHAGAVAGPVVLSGSPAFPSAAVGPPKISTLVDGFYANDLSTAWAGTYGTVTWSTGQVAIRCDTSYDSGLQAGGTFDLTGSAIFAKVGPYIAGSAATSIVLQRSFGNNLLFGYAGGSLAVNANLSGTQTGLFSVAYSATAHAWWRIREFGGTAFFDTAPDGVTWTNQYSCADTTFGFALTSLSALFQAGDYGSDPAGTSYVYAVSTITETALPAALAGSAVFPSLTAPSTPSTLTAPALSGTIAFPSVSLSGGPPTVRSQYAWPFAWNACWNIPISTSATYASPASSYSATLTTYDYSTQPYAVENNSVSPAFPVRTFYNGHDGPVPVYCDPNMSGTGQWNYTCAFLRTDGDSVTQGQTLELSPGGNPSLGGNSTYNVPDTSITTGTGNPGAHGGSSLSCLGGTITKAELQARRIPHAMKLLLNGLMFYSSAGAGYQWPAGNADYGYNQPGNVNYYGGSNPIMVEGALLAVPPSINVTARYADPLVQAIATAAQNYGFYLCDNTASGYGNATSAIEMNWDAPPYWTGTSTFGSDLLKMINDLQVVTSSTQATPGGGALGTPRRAAFAPPFTAQPKMSALTDKFTANDLAAVWGPSAGTVAWSAGQVAIRCDAAYDSYLEATGTFDLTGSGIYAKVSPYIAPAAATNILLGVSPGNNLLFGYSGGNLAAYGNINGAQTALFSIPYNAVAHAWWRVREASGTVYFDTAPDGVNWTTQYSAADYVFGFPLTQLNATFQCGDYGGDVAGTSYVYFVNAVGSVSATATTATLAGSAGFPGATPVTVHNVAVDFTRVITATDPLGVGAVLTEFGGNPIPVVASTAWKNAMVALAPGHLRFSLAWYGGNPSYGAGGSPGQQGSGGSTATTLLGVVKTTIGAIPLVSFNGNSSDNGFNPADAGAIVHFFNDSGGQNGGRIQYWSIGNEPDNTGGVAAYEAGSGTGSASAALAAMLAADPTITVGLPAAAYWDTGLISWAAGQAGVGCLSYHAYDGGNTDGTGFPSDPQIYNHIHTDLPGYKAGITYGVEEVNWNPAYTGQTQFYDWHNACNIADDCGQALSAGGHLTVYGDSNGALGLMNDGSGGQGQPGSFGTPFPAYWGLGIWTGMNGQFKRYSGHMVSAVTTFAQSALTVYASDNGKIVVVNKGTSAQALAIGVTQAGGATSGTYNVWATQFANPTGPITEVVTAAPFTGATISYTIPAGTAVSIDVTAGGGSAAPSAPDAAGAADSLAITGRTGTLLVNGFEEGAAGTTITAGNSAGTAVAAFDSVNAGTGGVVAYSAAQSAHGSLSALVQTGAAGNPASLTWAASLGTVPQVYGRAYLYLTAYPAVTDAVVQMQSGSGSPACNIQVSTAGNVVVQDSTFASAYTFPSPLPLNAWVRIEWQVVFTGTAGAVSRFWYYLLDSAAPVAGIAIANGNFGTAGVDEVDFGWTNPHPSQPPLYLDDVGVSTTGLLGPAVVPAAMADAAAAADTTAAAVSLALRNNADGGANGTTVTTGNSGGASGAAWNAVTITSGAATYSSAEVAHGTLAYAFSTTSGGGVANAAWNATSVGPQPFLYGRAYLYLSALPAADDVVIAFSASGTFGGGILIGSNGQLHIQNTAFGETVTGPTMPTGQWTRLEWLVVAGAAGAASCTVNYYSVADSTAIASTLTDTAGAYGSGGIVNTVSFGWNNTHPSQPVLYMDSIGLGVSGYLGPDILLGAELAAASDSLAVTGVALAMPDAAAAADALAAASTSVFTSMADAAGASESLAAPGARNVAAASDAITVTVALPLADTAAGADAAPAPGQSEAAAAGDPAGAMESLTVAAGPYLATPAAAPLPPAAPAFIRSQMPRMHVQNIITGQWLHHDVQGVSSPSVTWNLNQPDTFTCTLSPPRPDLLDASGNPLFQAWRDAVYLEENDAIRFGGLITGGTQSGAQWALSATGFAGYANGIPYDGPAYTEYNVDAGDVVRYIWNYVQSQANGNIRLQLTGQKIGALLGATVSGAASAYLTRPVTAADTVLNIGGWGKVEGEYVRMFLSNYAQGFSAGMDVTIGGGDYSRIITVVTDGRGVQTGEVHVPGPLSRSHAAGEQVLQQHGSTILSRTANPGDNTIWVDTPTQFSAGTVILLPGNYAHTISAVLADANGTATGQLAVQPGLTARHARGEQVVTAPTPFQLLWWNTPDCGQEIQSIQAEAIFDWREAHAWTSPAKEDVVHQLQFGAPRLGRRRTDLRFTEGENVIAPVQTTQGGTDYADSVILLGSGSGSAQVRVTASEPAGHLRRVQVYANQAMTTTARAASIGRRVLSAAESALDAPTQIVVANHPSAPFGSFACGDDIPVQLASGWRRRTFWCRITSIQQDPTTNVCTLTVARSDSFSYVDQSGLAGTI